MADTNSSPNPLQSPIVIDPPSQIPPNNNNNNISSPFNVTHNSPSIDIPRIGSPSISQSSQQSHPQQHQINQNVNSASFQQQQQQQLYQQQLMGNNSGVGNGMISSNLMGMHRSASLSRMSQQSQQQQQVNTLQQHLNTPQQFSQQQQLQQQVNTQQFSQQQQQLQQQVNTQQFSQQQHHQLQQQVNAQQQQVNTQQQHQQLQQQVNTQQQLTTQQKQQMSRQQQAALYGQMNFGGSMLNQQFRQQLGSGNMSGGSSMVTQSGNLQAAAAQFNIQSQLLGSPRQTANILQGSQFQRSNSLGQSAQVQALQMMGYGSQMRANGPISYGHRLNQAQLAQQLAQQSTLSSPQGQTLSGTSSLAYMNPQLSGLTQNGQSAFMQNSMTREQWLKQTTMTGPGSLRLQQHRQILMQQQMGQSSHLQQNMPLTSQQLFQLTQQQQSHSQLQQQQPQQVRSLQQPVTVKQQQQLQHQQIQQHQQQQLLPQQGPSGQKSLSLTGSQPDATVSGKTTPGGSSSQGTEATNQLLGKRKMQDLVSQVDARGKLDPEVEDLLLEIADDFIDSVITFACNLAKHRKSSTLESKDVLLHLEKNWCLTVPGYTSEEKKSGTDNPSSDLHMKRLSMMRALMDSSHSEFQNNANDMVRQGLGNLSGASHMMRPSPSSEQLVAQSAASQMLQQMTRF